MADTEKFAELGQPRRIWAVGAAFADRQRLDAIHDALWARFQPGDRLVYLGNMIGRGGEVAATLDTLLDFRRALLSAPGMLAGDIVYLRGAQEEMWQKLLQLHFAPNPGEVLEWMARQGVESTLAAYGGSVEQGMAAARGGTLALSRWTAGLRAAQTAHPGHDALFSALRRAAYTTSPGTAPPDVAPDAPPDGEANGVLLVSAGIDPSRPLGHQGDSFWWGSAAFTALTQPYGGFSRLVRGHDPAHGGVAVGDIAVTLDGGAGFGGPLVCGALDAAGTMLELFQI